MAQFEPKCLALTDRNQWHNLIRVIHIECNGKVVIADAKYKHWYRNNWDTRMHEDLRQVSGYARLKQIRDHFGIKDNEVPDCVIIYPDLENGNKSLDISDLTSKNIKQYLNISKVGVEIPIIQKV